MTNPPPTPSHADPFQTEPADVPVFVVGRRKATVVNLIFQYSTLALTVVHGLLMVPLYLRYIDNELYGAWLATGNVIYWAAVAQGGTTYLLSQRSAQLYGQRQMKALGEAVGSGLLLLTILSTLAALIAGVLTPFIPQWLQIEGTKAAQLEWAFIGAVVTLWLRLLCNGFIAIEQGYQRPLGVGIINVVTGVLHLVITVALLLLGWGLLAIPVALVIREVMCFIALAVHLGYSNRKLGVKMRITREAVKNLTSLSVWTFFTCLNDAIDNGTMLLLVALFLGSAKVTVVTVTRATWETLILILWRFVSGMQPGLAHLHGEGQRSAVIRVSNQMMLTLFAALAVGTAAILALNAPFVAIWGKPSLYAGDSFTILYLGVALFNLLNFAVSQVVLSMGAIRRSSILQTVLNTVRLLLMIALLVPLRILAVPVSAGITLVLLGWILMANWKTVVLQSSVVPWKGVLRGSRLVIVSGVVGYVGSRVLHPTGWGGLFLSASAVTAVMSLLVILLEPSMLDVMKQTLRSLRTSRNSRAKTT